MHEKYWNNYKILTPVTGEKAAFVFSCDGTTKKLSKLEDARYK